MAALPGGSPIDDEPGCARTAGTFVEQAVEGVVGTTPARAFRSTGASIPLDGRERVLETGYTTDPDRTGSVGASAGAPLGSAGRTSV